jgi:hypothetical protein
MCITSTGSTFGSSIRNQEGSSLGALPSGPGEGSKSDPAFFLYYKLNSMALILDSLESMNEECLPTMLFFDMINE